MLRITNKLVDFSKHESYLISYNYDLFLRQFAGIQFDYLTISFLKPISLVCILFQQVTIVA